MFEVAVLTMHLFAANGDTLMEIPVDIEYSFNECIQNMVPFYKSAYAGWVMHETNVKSVAVSCKTDKVVVILPAN